MYGAMVGSFVHLLLLSSVESLFLPFFNIFIYLCSFRSQFDVLVENLEVGNHLCWHDTVLVSQSTVCRILVVSLFCSWL